MSVAVPSLCRLPWLPMSFRRLDLDALWLSDLQVSEGAVRVWGVRVWGVRLWGGMVSEGVEC